MLIVIPAATQYYVYLKGILGRPIKRDTMSKPGPWLHWFSDSKLCHLTWSITPVHIHLMSKGTSI